MSAVQGKSGILALISLLAVFATLFGGLLVYEYTADEVTYRVYLEKFSPHDGQISGAVRLEITNKNDFIVEMSDIVVTLADPDDGGVFHTITHPGAAIQAGETIKVSLEFKDISYDLIPENSVLVHLTAKQIWNGEQRDIDITKTIPMTWG